MKRYVFTGDIKKLKDIGYKFQKLYAKNYKTYSKEKIIMYVVDKMAIEINNMDEHTNVLIKYILDNKNKSKSFWVEDTILNTNPPMPYNDRPLQVITAFGNIISSSEYLKNHKIYMKDLGKICNKRDAKFFGKISEEEAERQFIELDKGEFSRESFRIKINLVNQIIELDNLHPLEIKEIE